MVWPQFLAANGFEYVSRNSTKKESDDEVEEILETPRHLMTKKSKKRRKQMKGRKEGESSIQLRMTRERAKKLEKNKQQDKGFKNIAKKHRTWYCKTRRPTPEIDSNQQEFYDYLESKEK
jgi:hypothetical protein